jgi:hypothetical protein
MKLAKVTALLLLAAAGSGFAGEKTPEDLLAALKKAIAAKDVSQITALFCLDGVPDPIAKSLPQQLEVLTRQAVESVEIGDISAARKKQLEEGFPYQGKKLAANLPLVKEITIKLAKPANAQAAVSKITLPVGLKNGAYYIASSKVKD